MLIMLPAAIAALVLSGGVIGSLTGTSKVVSTGVGLKLLTGHNYRGREGFLTPTTSISMSDPEDAVGMFIVGLAKLFPELLPYTVKNGLPTRWVLTAPPEGKKRLGGEAKTLAALLEPIKVSFVNANGDEDQFKEVVTRFRLIPPVLDFLSQLPEVRITTD